jgi:hypothetical protein
MSKFDFDPATKTGSGKLRLESGSLDDVIPEEPGNSPPYEHVSLEPDTSSPDGLKHYLIGGDPELVKQIVAFYESKGKKVPEGYEDEAARHAAAVDAEKAKSAG